MDWFFWGNKIGKSWGKSKSSISFCIIAEQLFLVKMMENWLSNFSLNGLTIVSILIIKKPRFVSRSHLLFKILSYELYLCHEFCYCRTPSSQPRSKSIKIRANGVELPDSLDFILATSVWFAGFSWFSGPSFLKALLDRRFLGICPPSERHGPLPSAKPFGISCTLSRTQDLVGSPAPPSPLPILPRVLDDLQIYTASSVRRCKPPLLHQDPETII